MIIQDRSVRGSEAVWVFELETKESRKLLDGNFLQSPCSYDMNQIALNTPKGAIWGNIWIGDFDFQTAFADSSEVKAPQEKIETPWLELSSILYSNRYRSVDIGSQTLHEGDEYNGATIVKINTSGVEFEMNGRRWIQGVGDVKE